ncbi:helix-turn-helix domain-containing protein [Aureibaculum algae]|uniref:Helix-turn-helix domain-containing protein n=1 Tax=Aureibaculum algae TaxID=2584122 RepID=A0A5B7TMS4_9FLAO|nr:AraC family transcriptional regulator [Aureibaculum algae]QCX37598.1 helix-turn-helix domain-containing protein [Aureibaculum algae]
MKLVIKNTETLVHKRLNILKKEVACLEAAWHYHSQYELLYISKSNGIRFVGDSVSNFSAGDLVLVGPYLPHLWRNDASYYSGERTNRVKTIITKFNKDFIGEGTFNNPNFSKINKMLEESKYGICFDNSVSKKLHDQLIKLADLSITEQSIKLLDILHQLSITNSKVVLSSSDMRQYTSENSDKLDLVLKFISDNYSSHITLNDIADVACMTTNSFCRFFKKMTNKSFTQFLNEVRIRHASRLLVQNNIPISEACYLVGYNSVTNFHKQFKQIMNCTPKGYRKTI